MPSEAVIEFSSKTTSDSATVMSSLVKQSIALTRSASVPFTKQKQNHLNIPVITINPIRELPWVPEVFFSLGVTEFSREVRRVAKRRGKKVSRQQALLALTLLAAGEREDLWLPGYQRAYKASFLIELVCSKSQI